MDQSYKILFIFSKNLSQSHHLVSLPSSTQIFYQFHNLILFTYGSFNLQKSAAVMFL